MVEVKCISKTYKNMKSALKDVSYSFPKRSITGLLGPNGAGKTTLVKIICGLLYPDSGQVLIDGMKVCDKNRKHVMWRIGVTFEGVRDLYWRLSVHDNLLYSGRLRGFRTSVIKNEIDFLSEIFQFQFLLSRRYSTLSFGQKKLVNLASALVYHPEVVLLDEPSNGLDIDYRDVVLAGLQSVSKEQDTTIIITSHDIDFSCRIVKSFVVLNKGEIIKTIDNENLSLSDIETAYREALAKGNRQ